MISTDDGSLGFKGYVTEMLRQVLAGLAPAQLRTAVIFCCGPTPMMKATAAVAAQFAVQCQVSLEQPMACGMGTCQSCIIKYQPPGQKSWVYKLTCTDGPVFKAEDILW
jgi:dihydroorotate dehydrogenase electron transfer subunit